MANIDDLKKKAKDTLDTIVDVSAEAYKVAEDKAKLLARWTKLNAEITQEKARIRRLEGVVGKKYYELHCGAPEDELKESCDAITASLEFIATNKKELADMKKPAEASDAESEACEDDCCCDAECCEDEGENNPSDNGSDE